MGRRRKPINPALHWKRGDLAITQGLVEPIFTPQLSAHDIAEVDDVLISAGFPKNRMRARKLILTALANAQDYKKTPHKSYVRKKLTRASFGASRPRGRRQNIELRMMLIAALFIAWRITFKKEPRVNRKIVKKDLRTVRTPFVAFAAPILALAKVGQIEENLTWYRSYEKAVYAGLSFEQWLSKQPSLKRTS
jgi:hypothetical protein